MNPLKRLVLGVTARTALRTAAKKKGKFGNVKTEVDGIKFDSKREAERYKSLLLLIKSGRVRNLKRQVVFDLVVNGYRVCKYRADFVYEEYENRLWTSVVEDVKGPITQAYRIKRKLMRACHGIVIRET